MLIDVAFSVFAALTVAFALAFLWRLLPKPTREAATPVQPAHVNRLQALAANQTDDYAKSMAEALATALKAIGDFGSKLDSLGPTALLGIFTVIFALLTVGCAWIARVPG